MPIIGVKRRAFERIRGVLNAVLLWQERFWGCYNSILTAIRLFLNHNKVGFCCHRIILCHKKLRFYCCKAILSHKKAGFYCHRVILSHKKVGFAGRRAFWTIIRLCYKAVLSLKKRFFVLFQKLIKAFWARLYLENALLSDFHSNLRLILSVFWKDRDALRLYKALLRIFKSVFTRFYKFLTSYSLSRSFFGGLALFFLRILRQIRCFEPGYLLFWSFFFAFLRFNCAVSYILPSFFIYCVLSRF